jgi:hypothetical protein
MKQRTMMKKLRVQLVLCLALAIGVSLSLSGCGDKKKNAGTDEPSPGEVNGEQKPKPQTDVTPPEPVGGTTQSEHFAAVAKHLDLGGEIFGYVDVDGDVEKIADIAQEFLDMAKQEAGEDMPPHLKTLDLAKVLGKVGLDGIEAMGASSYLDGDLYHNKGFMYVPGGRKGLLKVLGGDATPFVAKTLAPKDTDLVIEQSLDLRAGYDVVSALVADLGGPDAADQFNQAVGEVIPQLGLTMADLLRKLDTRITVIGRIHPDKPLEIPDAPAEIPSFDLLIVLDDLGWLYEKMTTNMKTDMPADEVAQIFTKGEGFEKMGLPPMPSPEMAIVQPVAHHDIANKRVLIASTQAFLDECLAGATKLSDSADFTAAVKGLPTEGNGLSYVSANLLNEYRKFSKAAMQAQPEGGEAAMVTAQGMMAGIMDQIMPEAKASQASVTVNTPEGILMASNSSQSFKQSVMMGGVSVGAMVAAISLPALSKAQDRAKEMKAEMELRNQEMEEQIRALDNAPPPAPIAPAPIPAPGE